MPNQASLNQQLIKSGACLYRPCCRHSRQGFSLLEMLLVVVILSIAAKIALPNLATATPARLDRAANELAEALRFARAEAIRTGTLVGVQYSASTPSISVCTISLILGFISKCSILSNPVDHNPYTLNYAGNGNQAPVTLNSVTWQYGGNNLNYIVFGSHGTPVYPIILISQMTMLTNASVVIAYAGQIRTINVSPMTGRVSIQ
jgi:prepilin-type N-terminal cleavage/methylation domain-containing protein